MDSTDGPRTSLKVFRRFIIPKAGDKPGELCADGVVSRACYELWLETRKGDVNNPEKAFQKALSAHISGADGRKPFMPAEEYAILQTLRRKKPWPCFDGGSVKYGRMGYRAKGFHEKRLGLTIKPHLTYGEIIAMQQEEYRNKVSDEHTDNMSSSEHSQSRSDNKLKRQRISATTDAGTGSDEDNDSDESDGAHSIPNPDYPFDLVDEIAGNSDAESKARPTVDDNENETESKDGDEELGDLDQGMLDRDLLSRLDNRIARWVYLKCVNLVTTLNAQGLHGLKTVLNLLRYILLSIGRHGPESEAAVRKIFEDRCREFPDDMIFFLDMLAPNYKDRFRFQNRKAVQFLGKISREYGGAEKPIFPPSHLFRAIAATWRAWWRPKTHYGLNSEFICQNGHVYPVRMHVQANPDISHVCVRIRLDEAECARRHLPKINFT